MSGRAQIERVGFVDGRRLRADDLTDAARGEQRHVELHVVGAHDTWGIATGLAVIADGPPGIVVGPGAAFDMHGRVFTVEDDAVVAAPAELLAAGTPLVLVLDGDGPHFVAAADVRLGAEVPLAAFTLDGGTLSTPNLSVRRVVRSLARARTASGSATIRVRASNGVTPRRVFVDTSAAGFVDSPSYALTRTREDDEATVEFLWIENPGPGGFTVAGIADLRTKDPYDVPFDWLGAEAPPGCRPAPKE